MDSTVCATLAARDYDSYALHFSYGQRTEQRELESAQAVSSTLGFRQFPSHFAWTCSASSAAPPSPTRPSTCPRLRKRESVTKFPSPTFPSATPHFLSAAVSWAEVLGARTVFIGAVEQDSSGYPDCRPAYYDAFNALIQQGTQTG